MAEKLYDEATEEEHIAKNMEVPMHVSMMTSICTEFWKLEAADFCDEVAKQAEAAFLKELEEWEALQKAPKTPQQFHQ